MALVKVKTRVDRRRTPFLSKDFNREFGNLSREIAFKTAKRIRRRIREQRISLAPLSTRWKSFKAKHGLDPRILIATGTYVASIQPRQLSKDRWVVAPAANVTMANKNKAISTLGLWLEFGTQFMPPRPHFRPEIKVAEALMLKQGRESIKKIRRDWARQPVIRRTFGVT